MKQKKSVCWWTLNLLPPVFHRFLDGETDISYDIWMNKRVMSSGWLSAPYPLRAYEFHHYSIFLHILCQFDYGVE